MTCAHGNCKNEEAGVWKIYEKNCKGAILVVIGGKFVTYTHWLRALYLTRYSTHAERELFEMFEYDIATNGVNYLQSISFGK